MNRTAFLSGSSMAINQSQGRESSRAFTFPARAAAGQTGDPGREAGHWERRRPGSSPSRGTQVPFPAPPPRPSPAAADPELPRTPDPGGRLAGAPSSSGHPREGSAEDALPEAASGARPARPPAKVGTT